MRHQKESNQGDCGQNQFTLGAIVFVSLMFLTISAANIYMQSDRSTRPTAGAHEERAGTFDAGGMERSSASR